MTEYDLQTSTSLYKLDLEDQPAPQGDLARIQEWIELAAQLLPAEGPVGSFVFQNPLHALEFLPFEEAMRRGTRLFGCHTYLGEDRYRKELEQKRIDILDLRSVLEEDLEGTGWEMIAGLVSRLNLRLAMLRTPIMFGADEEVRWFIAEKEGLSRFREGTPIPIRDQIVKDVKRWVIRDVINKGSKGGAYQAPGREDDRRQHVLWPLLPMLAQVLDGNDERHSDDWVESVWDKFALHALWRVCQQGVGGTLDPFPEKAPCPLRTRDLLLEVTGTDTDNLVHDVLIRFCGAFTDQGLAHWSLPNQDKGFFQAFASLYGRTNGFPDLWLRGLGADLAEGRTRWNSPLESIRDSLDRLGIPEAERKEFLQATLLALRGWASLIRQMEVRPDRVARAVPHGTLTDFLAVRLILERHAMTHVARERLNYSGPLENLREWVQKKFAPKRHAAVDQRTFGVFQLAQVFGWGPSALHSLSGRHWKSLLEEIRLFSEIERRRVFHLAYENRYRTDALAAIGISAGIAREQAAVPRFQAMFCIDAREESFRRHLEEIQPDVETFGAAGFYSIPMYYKGVADAHFSPLCPIVLRPQHWVTEEVPYSLRESHGRWTRTRQLMGNTSHQFHKGTRSFASGALLTGSLGVLATIPLVARVLFPRWTSSLVRFASSLVPPPPVTRPTWERVEADPGPVGDHLGFSLEEMADFGERVLRDIGLTERFARLVFIFGHGSSSLNNPHLSAYHCGACSGNAGGPNARALATFLNDRRVRAVLAARGLPIPDRTVFIGGFHDTSKDLLEYFDLDNLPMSHIKEFEEALEILENACNRNAHERCRRFYSAPLNISPEEARELAMDRSEDLAQTRVEFGNATNACCFVGRRERIRGLFLDRRSFLHSYDPTRETEDAAILARILSAVVPVCQGINLEYYFSAVDPVGWGCGSKLPHNVTSLLGVMDGAASDIRQGLPWQGVEIHEPLRILFVIETTPAVMRRIMAGNPTIERIIGNGWAQLALLDPESTAMWLFRKGEFHDYAYARDGQSLPRVRTSADWFVGRRDHLPFALIDPTA